MDGREHHATTPPPHKQSHQKDEWASDSEHHARETAHFLLARLEQVQAGNEDALVFFDEALHRQDTSVQTFLEQRGNQGDDIACLLLRGYYLSLLKIIRAGNEDATTVLYKQIHKLDPVAHRLLLELTIRGDRTTHELLLTAYDDLLKYLWQENVDVLVFFNEQLQHQNDVMLAFLSERVTQDERVATILLHPYYQSLIPQAIRDEQAMEVCRKQLLRNDEVIQRLLVEQVERGNDDAFRIVWQCYRPEIERYVQRQVGGASARLIEELAQAIFTKAWRSLPKRNKKEQKMHIRAWLYKVASSEIFDYFDSLKVRRVEASLPLKEINIDSPVPGPENEVCMRDCLKEALLRLSKRARTCVLMADVYGYSTQDIATTLDIQQNTVTSYLSRVRAKLRLSYLQALGPQYEETQQTERKPHVTKKSSTDKQDSGRRGENHE